MEYANSTWCNLNVKVQVNEKRSGAIFNEKMTQKTFNKDKKSYSLIWANHFFSLTGHIDYV